MLASDHLSMLLGSEASMVGHARLLSITNRSTQQFHIACQYLDAQLIILCIPFLCRGYSSNRRLAHVADIDCDGELSSSWLEGGCMSNVIPLPLLE